MMLRLRYSLLAIFWLIFGTAAASDLQVSPVSLNLLPTHHAEGLWLTNTGEAAVRAQVRVYRWTQEEGMDKLMPATALTVSPPMLQVVPGDRQLVRAIRLGSPPNGLGAVQEAYRMIIDELPEDGDVSDAKQTLQFRMRYSIPVFVDPVGPRAAPPQLSWAIRTEGSKAVLEVTNSGAVHAQLGTMSFTDTAGHRTEISTGLLGYVLPGAQMHWDLTQAPKVFANGGTLEVMLNKKIIQEAVLPVPIVQ